MVALSIDTAANICAACINDLDSGEVLASISHDIGRGHAELLMDTIGQCMKQANCSYGQVERVISSVGPGSFTGVRVGLSAARAIGLGLSKPVVGVSNLLACAHYAIQIGSGIGVKRGRDIDQNLHQDLWGRVSVILDARRNEVYFQQFENSIAIGKACVLSLEELVRLHQDLHGGEVVYCGSSAEEFQNALAESGQDAKISIAHHLATAPIENIAALGMTMRVSQMRPQPPQPLYLRGADAKQQQGFAVPLEDIRNTDGAP
jgi:tRNA threonylcarbamoyladenosine biosynthesis protein TsaB